MKHFVIFTLIGTIKAMSSGVAENNGLPMSSIKAVDIAAMKMIKNTGDKNIIASPLGVVTLLSMYCAGTQGQSRNEIMELLGFTDFEWFQESYINLTDRISSTNDESFLLANKIFISDNFTLDDNFSNVVRSYKSEVELVDFRHKANVTGRINQWVGEKTKGLITSCVNEDMIDDETVLALFNIIYFMGKWKYQFDVSETEEGEFYVDESTTIQKPMMKLIKCLSYEENPEIGARVVELPYRHESTRMIVVLPDKKDGLSNVLNKLAERGLLESFPSLFSNVSSESDVMLEMPKFEVTSNLDLKEILSKMGVSGIFQEGAAGLVRDQALIVSKAFQKAHVKVDEMGTTATAATGFGIMFRSGLFNPKFPIIFKVDRPFLYAILHENTVNFVGTYTH